MRANPNDGEFWLVPGKVRPPAPTPFHLERPNLLSVVEGNDWSVVSVTAPAGFGKTTLLAELCRRAKDRNMVAAWLTIDEQDTPEGVDLYLAAAFELAGLAIARHAGSIPTAALVEQIERHGMPCLLVVDEVERTAPAVMDTLDFLVHNAPQNLQILLGMRRNPGLDLGPVVLSGRGAQFDADWLRFSGADIDAYFGAGLSPRKLAELTRATAGWPIAVSLLRQSGAAPSAVDAAGGAMSGRDVSLTADWLGSRLFGNLGNDGDFVLDLGQFDWIEADLVDEVLDIDDSERRIAGLVLLEGLVQPIGDSPGRARLHELIRRYCADTLRHRNPDRYREVHRGLARALVARGHIDAAARHAADAGDAALIGEVYSSGGGLALLLREGIARLGGALDRLNEEVTQRYPRLAILRCRMLVHRARLREARVLFERARIQTADFTRDPGDAKALVLEAAYVEAILIGYGCMGFDARYIDRLTDSYWRATGGGADPAIAAALGAVLYAACQMRAMFGHGRQYGRAAMNTFTKIASPHGTFHININMGIAAMAQGRVEEAEQLYTLAARIADEDLADRQLRQAADILLAELRLECNRMDAVRLVAAGLPVPLRNGTIWLDIIVAAHDVIARWRFETGGVDAALDALQTCHDACESLGMPAACRHLAASRVAYLALDGRVEQANREWVDAGFPNLEEDIVRLDRQSWREMETLACARVRLLIAAGRLGEARNLATHLVAVAAERGLVRTLLRGLALSMVIEHRAGQIGGAAAHLLAYLARLPETGFSAPLIHDPNARRIFPDVLAGTSPEPPIQAAIDSLLRQRGDALESDMPEFTQREREVVALLGEGRRDKEIGRRLSLSVHGVRFHLRNIYRKTGASNRAEAIKWATAKGLIDP